MRDFQETLLQVLWIPVPQCFLKILNHIPRPRKHPHQGTTAWDHKLVAASPNHLVRENACCHGGKRSFSKWPARNFWIDQKADLHSKTYGWRQTCRACLSARPTDGRASLTWDLEGGRPASVWAVRCPCGHHTHFVQSVNCSETGVLMVTVKSHGHRCKQKKAVAFLKVLERFCSELLFFFSFL